MKKNQIIIAILLLLTVSLNASIQLVPYPQVLKESGYDIEIPLNLKFDTDDYFIKERELLKSYLNSDFKFTPIFDKKSGYTIQMKHDVTYKKEQYLISANKKQIILKAGDNAGMFYAIQTLRQLMLKKNDKVICPAVEIFDYPAFEWRGFMLDDARAFKGVEVVKNLLDEMALMKMNVFQWHLTEDQGWRIEIKKYPLLTQIGGRRDSTQLDWYENDKYDGNLFEGYYTQDQIRDIVKYAADRHILIVPEIEMPGHCSAAIAAYPWLGCTGKKIKVPCDFGVMYDVFNVADSRVIAFLEDVLQEVITLFPGGIIHIGGDEVRYDQWNANQQVLDYMKKHDIFSCAELQVKFTNDMASRIEKMGKRMMGWNDITGDKLHHFQGNDENENIQKLSPTAIVQFWLGDNELIKKAAQNGHDIVNAFHEYTYVNYNHDKITPGKAYSFSPISLEKAYSFSPIPKDFPTDLHAKIIGLSCQMWGEWIPSIAQMNKMIFPIWATYAETGWTAPENKNFERFNFSVQKLIERWRIKGYCK